MLSYEQLSLNILDSLETGIIMINTDNKITYVNNAYAKYLSKAKDELAERIFERSSLILVFMFSKSGIAEYNSGNLLKLVIFVAIESQYIITDKLLVLLQS